MRQLPTHPASLQHCSCPDTQPLSSIFPCAAPLQGNIPHKDAEHSAHSAFHCTGPRTVHQVALSHMCAGVGVKLCVCLVPYSMVEPQGQVLLCERETQGDGQPVLNQPCPPFPSHPVSSTSQPGQKGRSDPSAAGPGGTDLTSFWA